MFTLVLSAVSLVFSQIGLTLIVLFGLLYYYITKDRDYFEKRNIPYVKPTFLLGNQAQAITRTATMYECYDNVYRAHKDASVVGVFELLSPTYMIKDPELIKQVMIKEFDSFINHRIPIEPESDPVFAKNLFGSTGQIWKELRTLLSPAFTGSKMRFLYALVRDCADRTVDKIKTDMNNGEYPFEAKDLFSKCANDVISTSAFGIVINSLEDKDNEIYQNVLKLTNFDATLAMKFFLYMSFPKFMNFFKVRLFARKLSVNLRKLLLDVVKQREQSGEVRPDMIHILLQAKNKGRIDDDDTQTNGLTNKPKTIIDDEDYFVAQCLVFFFAGFETVSQVFTFLNYELALNPQVQKTLQAEIDEVNKQSNGKSPTYEQITNMKYLDLTIQEALRKFPPVIFLDRACNRTVTVQDSAGKTITFQPGDQIVIPTYSFHYDPKFFPKPEEFDPLRFLEENKRPEHNFVYQPFGIGPRRCLGSRFALMEVKIFMYKLLLEFDILRNAKTEVPLQMVKGEAQFKTANGVHLTFKKRINK